MGWEASTRTSAPVRYTMSSPFALSRMLKNRLGSLDSVVHSIRVNRSAATTLGYSLLKVSITFVHKIFQSKNRLSQFDFVD